jgi:hypothetical protein
LSAPAPAADGISIREFARRSGLDDKQVRRGIESGRLKSLADGKLDPADVGTAWRKSIRHRADNADNADADNADKVTPVRTQLSAPAVAPKAKPEETPEAAAERIVRESGATMSLGEAETLKENYLALLRQLEYDVKSGLVVAVADVARIVGEQYAQVRTRLLAIPAEQAPQLHRLKSVAELQDALMATIVEALEGLTRDGAVSTV